MSFKEFTSPNKVKQLYADLIISKDTFVPVAGARFDFPEHLWADVKFALKAYKPNEAFADKFLIAPILNAVWRNHASLNVWAQPYIKIDDILQGRPDYLVSPLDKQQYEVLSAPILVVIEAKLDNFSHGWGQCLAGMLACQKINKNPLITVYGIVSTGLTWEFGKLSGNDFIRDINPLSVSDLQATINAIDYVFGQSEKEIPKTDPSIITQTNEWPEGEND